MVKSWKNEKEEKWEKKLKLLQRLNKFRNILALQSNWQLPDYPVQLHVQQYQMLR